MNPRTHALGVRITPEQRQRAREALAAAPDGLTIQKVLNAGLNAWLLGHLIVQPSGRHRVAPPKTDEVHDLDALLEGQRGLPADLDPTPWFTTRTLAHYLADQTGQTVSMSMLREYLKRDHPHLKIDGRWRVRKDDVPLLRRMRYDVSRGLLTQLRDERMAEIPKRLS